ncbi:hypothetical protein INS49_002063 [Diaporthe citri]|uniref:uncharacterized protein n=1 Tax=Diaporthe citri TaxID=83186 RepID=UPI001C7F2145|nr:uncharacterized protein INS49_002063 [Diaporthe citri]KAG6367867.1 hypothetical protein INS49_002063 [Diaporthe citri]
MEKSNATGLISAVVKAATDGPGAVNSSTPHPRIPGPGDRPVQHPMVSVYIIIVAVVIVFTLLIWRGVHESLMAARARRLIPNDPEHTHKTTSLWIRLVRLAWTGVKALFMSFLNIFTKTFWKDMWSDTKRTFSPLSSCGICLNAYFCGLVCNPDTDDDVTMPVTEWDSAVVAQSSMTMPKTSTVQRPLPTVVVEEMV